MIALPAAVTVLLSLVTATAAQTSRPAFEVASIKRNLSSQEGGGGGPRGDRFTMKNVTLSSLIVGNAVPAASLVDLLQGQADRIVFDKTGLMSLFDFDIEYSTEVTAPRAANNDAEPGPAQPAPSLFTVLGELGLKLEPSKAPLPVIVIGSAQHPSEN
jgi:Protein of unknown function (DUF3738)